MNILEFYKKCENKYGDIKNIPDRYYETEAKKRLQDAPLKALLQLKILCGKDEKMMFAILQAFLLLPLSMRVHKMEATFRKKKTKEIDNKKRRLKKKIENKTKQHVFNVLTFLPDTNEKALINGARNHLMMDKVFKAELEAMNGTIKKHKKGGKDWHGKTNLLFKNIINETFLMSKEKTDLSDRSIHNYIAKLLNCLKIKNTQGKPYTVKNIQHHCKTPSR